MSEPVPSAAPRLLAGGWIGVACFGLADALAVVSRSRLVHSLPREALLALASSAALFLVLLPAVGLAAWWGLRREARNPLAFGLASGLVCAGLLDMADWWFTAPPPHTESFPLHGNPLVFVAVTAAVVTATTRLVRLPGWALGVVCGVVLMSEVGGGLRPGDAGVVASPLPQGTPDLLLVSIDTTRADHYGAYGNKTVRTPNFDAMAAQGVLFEAASAQIPVTGPSHTTLHTGAGPWDHGSLLNGIPIDPAYGTLAQTLSGAGWRTGAFVSGYVLDGELGFQRGFEVYDDDFGWLQGWADTLPGRLHAGVVRHFDPAHVLERRGGRTVDQALAWIGQDDARPFFAWVHLFDPHGPYAPPPPWDTAYYAGDPRDPGHTSMEQVSGVADYLLPSLEGITDVDWVRAQYAGETSYADEQLGRLLGAVDPDRTLVVVVGDHGESLGEDGIWFNHGEGLTTPQLHVPMALRMPGRLPKGERVARPVELTDVAPTIYELLKVPTPGTVTGQSLLDEPGRLFARSLCYDRERNLEARRKGQAQRPTFRMVALSGPSSHYEWHDDGTEKLLWAEGAEPADPGAVEEVLRAEAEALAGSMDGDAASRSTQELSPEQREKLKALGYIE